MMRSFVHDQPAIRVIFGAGAIDRLAVEIEALGVRRALVLASPGQRTVAEAAVRQLGARSAGLFSEPAPHVPIDIARKARDLAAQLDADGCVTIGGGSTIGLGKSIALERSLRLVAVPTTYSGSEMTPIYGVTDGGVKRTGRDPKVQPQIVIYDAALTVSLPSRISGPSGMNAIAHSVEALYAPNASPIVSLLAADGIRALARALPTVVDEPANLDARANALYGAWLCGSALAATSMGVHHKLCHTLGGTFGLPHADVHAVILPHAAAFNRADAPEAMRIVAEALGSEDAAQGLYALAVRIGAPVSLREIGMAADGLDRAARLATESPYANPRAVDYAGVRQLLEDGFRGRRPAL